MDITSPPPFDYSLSHAGDISVQQGSSVSQTITLKLTSGTSQPVQITEITIHSDNPGYRSANSIYPYLGSTARSYFSSPAVVTPSDTCNPTCSITITFYVRSDAPTGRYPIFIDTSGGGVIRKTTFYMDITQ